MDSLTDSMDNFIPAQPATEGDSGIPQPVDTPIEDQLNLEIIDLWSENVRLNENKKFTAKELRQIRTHLAEKLFEMKSLLSRPGRNGEWRGWLRERKIPRSTADRLVTRHAETVSKSNEGNVLTEAINDGEDTVEKLVHSLLPRLKRNLPDTQSVFQFIASVGDAFGLTSEIAEDCITVSQPKPDQNPPDASAADALEAESAEVDFPNADTTSPEPEIKVGVQV